MSTCLWVSNWMARVNLLAKCLHRHKYRNHIERKYANPNDIFAQIPIMGCKNIFIFPHDYAIANKIIGTNLKQRKLLRQTPAETKWQKKHHNPVNLGILWALFSAGIASFKSKSNQKGKFPGTENTASERV